MDHSVSFQPAYILHARPYRDTSVIADFFTPDYGKVSGVVRGAKRPKSRYRGLVQPFVPLLISWHGRSELKTVKDLESHRPGIYPNGQSLFCGLYINELLMRLLQPFDSHFPLYVLYEETLTALQGTSRLQPVLRRFERQLLEQLGYGLYFREAPNGVALEPQQLYRYVAEVGFVRQSSLRQSSQPLSKQGEAQETLYRGQDLLAIAADRYDDPETLRAAKHLMRQVLSPLLGPRPLRTRELMMKRRRPQG